MRFLVKFDLFLERATATIGGVFIVGMATLMFVTTFLRYLAGISFPWTEEILKMMMAWSILLILGVVTRRNEHIRMTFFAEKIFGVERAPKVWAWLENLFGIGTYGFFTWVGWRWTMFAYEHNIRAVTTGLPWRYPLWIIQIAFLVGFGIMTLFYLERIVKQILLWRYTTKKDSLSK
ncbi:TRAP transporter small permease [Chloroflexota bacterium]